MDIVTKIRTNLPRSPWRLVDTTKVNSKEAIPPLSLALGVASQHARSNRGLLVGVFIEDEQTSVLLTTFLASKDGVGQITLEDNAAIDDGPPWAETR